MHVKVRWNENFSITCQLKAIFEHNLMELSVNITYSYFINQCRKKDKVFFFNKFTIKSHQTNN